jgi:hypothetical protein
MRNIDGQAATTLRNCKNGRPGFGKFGVLTENLVSEYFGNDE